jgi:ribonuclease BN (tRNA processing enzyme)
MNIVPMDLMTPISITDHYKVFAFPTKHRVPSQGYGVVHRQVGGLLPEYQKCTRDELAALRRGGAELNKVTERVEVVYTGDTVMEGLLLPDFSFVREAELLIMELTYLDGDRAKASTYGHIHLDDFTEAHHMFQNRQIIFVHLSAKYFPPNRALNTIRNRVPDEIVERCAVSLKSFGYREAVTMIATEPLTPRCLPCNKRRSEDS